MPALHSTFQQCLTTGVWHWGKLGRSLSECQNRAKRHLPRLHRAKKRPDCIKINRCWWHLSINLSISLSGKTYMQLNLHPAQSLWKMSCIALVLNTPVSPSAHSAKTNYVCSIFLQAFKQNGPLLWTMMDLSCFLRSSVNYCMQQRLVACLMVK